MNEITKKVQEELDASFEKLKTLEEGSEERKKLLGNMALLNNMYLEGYKTEEKVKSENSKSGKTLEWCKILVPVAGSVCTFILYAALFKMGLRFEETGTVASATVKHLFQGLLRPKM